MLFIIKEIKTIALQLHNCKLILWIPIAGRDCLRHADIILTVQCCGKGYFSDFSSFAMSASSNLPKSFPFVSFAEELFSLRVDMKCKNVV